ncbi:MAG: PorV/PorQ family protein [Elusimicrobia bacterium]|nr:PorV/PorQ family protein [Elusimicrobiota bacterium]
MKTKKRILISVIFSLIVFCFSNLHAQSTGLEFLNIAPGARSAGMGEAFTPLADDLNAVYYNPAGLGFITRSEFQATYSYWLGDTYIGSGGFLYPSHTGTVALNGTYLGGTPITRFEEGSLKDTFNASDMSAGISYGIKASKTFSLGLTGKSVTETLDTNYSANILCGDAGFILRTENGAFSFGYAARNLGVNEFSFSNSLIKEKMPLTQSVGIALKLDMPEQSSLINFVLQGDQPASGQTSYSAGIEHWGANVLALRLGYKYFVDEKNTKALDSMSGLRAGLGIHINGIGFDYAYQPFAAVGDTHRVSFVIKFAPLSVTPKTFDMLLKIDPAIFSPNNDGIKDSTFFLPQTPPPDKNKIVEYQHL